MIRRSAFGGGNVGRQNQWTYFSEGIATVNQSRVPRPLLAMGGRINTADPNPNTVASQEPDDHLECDRADGSNGGQPESSPTAAKLGAPRVPQTPRRLRTYCKAKTSRIAKASTGTARQKGNRGGLDGANDTEPDDSESDFAEIFFHNFSVGLVPDSEVILDIPLGKQPSAPLSEARVLSSGRQIPGLVRDLVDRKKEPTSTPIYS